MSVCLRRFGALVALLVALVLPVMGAVSVQHAAAADAGSAISLSLNCTGNPEYVKVTNNTAKTITVKTVSSIYQLRSGEPYTVNATISAGKTKTFESGPSADLHVLTHQYIYANDAGSSEGVRVVTSVGSKTKHCSGATSGSGGGSSGGGSTGGSSHPAGATAKCNDGTYSYAAHHQGACSYHGGVAVFYS